jgi:hypothetical protein
MIKLVHCVRRRPELGVEEFRAAWDSFSQRWRELGLELGAVRVSVSTTLEIPLNEALTRARGSAPPFDGIAEITWPSGATLPARASDPGDLRALQEEFIDVAGSAFFFVHEEPLAGGDEAEA